MEIKLIEAYSELFLLGIRSSNDCSQIVLIDRLSDLPQCDFDVFVDIVHLGCWIVEIVVHENEINIQADDEAI